MNSATTTTTTTGAAPDVAEEASEYTFRNADPQGPRQLTLLADILDDHTTEALASIGIGAGWRCLDIGPGAGTVTRWIAGQVGPTGGVTALDLDPRHIAAAGNVTVLQGDVRTVELPPEHYNLIHARLVLLHLTDRDRAVIARLLANHPVIRTGDHVLPGGIT